MKRAFGKLISKLHSVYLLIFSSIQNRKTKHLFQVLSVEADEFEQYVALIQVTGKSEKFRMKPAEILLNDKMTNSFSQCDIRLLTCLGYLEISSPKLKVVSLDLLEADKQIRFTILERGNKTPILKTAADISLDKQLIEGLSPTDAHMIGYAAASEQFRITIK